MVAPLSDSQLPGNPGQVIYDHPLLFVTVPPDQPPARRPLSLRSVTTDLRVSMPAPSDYASHPAADPLDDEPAHRVPSHHEGASMPPDVPILGNGQQPPVMLPMPYGMEVD